MEQLTSAVFPRDFRFGIGDSDLQVIGEESCLREENAEPTLWTHFAETSNEVFMHETPRVSVDRYHRYREDIALIQGLGVTHYRTSVSICRTMHADGSINKQGIAWYRGYFQALREAGIKVSATLYHWEMPMWLHARGGWKDRGIVDVLGVHAKIVYDELHELIDEYFLVNEPFQCTLTSYHLGEHAPGERSLTGGFLAVHNALLAQGTMFRVLKECDPGLRISTVYNARPFYAASTSEDDVHAALLASQYQTRIFTDPLYLGRYPEELQLHFKNEWPTIDPADLSVIRIGDGLSAFGLNYYRGQIIRSLPGKELPWEEVRYPRGTVNGLSWPVFIPPVYPEGLYDILRELYDRFSSYGMRCITITENGACALDTVDHDGIIHDHSRIAYIEKHLEHILKAILAGVPVGGYFLWTLLDNYEWDQGYKPGSQFGIVHVDPLTQTRTPKESYGWYRDIVRNRRLPFQESMESAGNV